MYINNCKWFFNYLFNYIYITIMIEPIPVIPTDSTKNAAIDNIQETIIPAGDKNKELDPDPAPTKETNYEKRFKDTQKSYTQSQQKNSELEAVNKFLKEQLDKQKIPLNITPEQEDELEQLKFSDPDAWKSKLDVIEKKSAKDREKSLAKAKFDSEISKRESILKEFIDKHPNFVINDKIIANQLPASYANELHNSKITFEAFLEKARKFLGAKKVILKSEDSNSGPNIGKFAGESTDSEGTKKAVPYEKVIF